jgi:hypothetical protein
LGPRLALLLAPCPCSHQPRLGHPVLLPLAPHVLSMVLPLTRSCPRLLAYCGRSIIKGRVRSCRFRDEPMPTIAAHVMRELARQSPSKRKAITGGTRRTTSRRTASNDPAVLTFESLWTKHRGLRTASPPLPTWPGVIQEISAAGTHGHVLTFCPTSSWRSTCDLSSRICSAPQAYRSKAVPPGQPVPAPRLSLSLQTGAQVAQPQTSFWPDGPTLGFAARGVPPGE